jgi:hypothetical protein
MPDPRFDGIEAVGLDVEETKKMWSTYKEYVPHTRLHSPPYHTM